MYRGHCVRAHESAVDYVLLDFEYSNMIVEGRLLLFFQVLFLATRGSIIDDYFLSSHSLDPHWLKPVVKIIRRCEHLEAFLNQFFKVWSNFIDSRCMENMDSLVSLVAEIVHVLRRFSVDFVIPTIVIYVSPIPWKLPKSCLKFREVNHMSLLVACNTVQVFTGSDRLAWASQIEHFWVYEIIILEHILQIGMWEPHQFYPNANDRYTQVILLALLRGCKLACYRFELVKFL